MSSPTSQGEKKVFEHYYADSDFERIVAYLRSKVYNEDGSVREYNPYIVIEIIPSQ